MKIAINKDSGYNGLIHGTLIPASRVITEFDIREVGNGFVNSNEIKNKLKLTINDDGTFSGSYRDSARRVNLWENLKNNHPDLYKSQLLDLTSVPAPKQNNREPYKQFIANHKRLYNTIKYFMDNWKPLFKSVLNIPDDHKDYRIIREWINELKSVYEFLTDFLDDGSTMRWSDETLAEYHQRLVDNIQLMSVTGSNNDLQMIIDSKFENSKLNTIEIDTGMAYVTDVTFNKLLVSYKQTSAKQSFGCICLKNCRVEKVESSTRTDVLAIENSFVGDINVVVYDTAYLNNVRSDKPIDINITIAETLAVNNVNLTKQVYDTISSMKNAMDEESDREFMVYPFERVEELVKSYSVSTYINGHNNPPHVEEGSFIGKFKELWLEPDMLKREISKLNTNKIEGFAIYSDDPKLNNFIFQHAEGKKYKNIDGSMFYLLKRLLTK